MCTGMERNPGVPPRSWGTWMLTLLLLTSLATKASAWQDGDGNRIDDRSTACTPKAGAPRSSNAIRRKRMRIGVENPAERRLRHLRRSTTTARPPSTRRRCSAPGVSMVVAVPEHRLHRIARHLCADSGASRRCRASRASRRFRSSTRINHYGSRVVRARDSRGLSASRELRAVPERAARSWASTAPAS